MGRSSADQGRQGRLMRLVAVPGLAGTCNLLRMLGRSHQGPTQRIALVVAMAGPCGLSPVAPATVGSVVGTAAAWAMASTGLGPLLLTAILLVMLAAWSGSIAEADLQVTDPAAVTIDEVAGAFIAGVGVAGTFHGALLSFAAFRVLDAVKPPPARRLQRWPAGWGIVADDVVAGLYANLVVRIAIGWLA